jgi:hypothetical protein
MPSSGGPSPFGWTTSSPSSHEHSLAQAWHLGQGEGPVMSGAWWPPPDEGRRPLACGNTGRGDRI